MDASVAVNLEQSTLRKVYLRLIPYSFVIYILCYVDHINVSFASLTMNRDIGLTAHIYGLTAGAFFWGYCLLEVPSNIILQKVGARIWIARIMISWGLLSAATALVTGPVSFFIVRVLLGAAEAGLFPGLMVYFYRWFPQRHRGRVVGWFLTSLPLATVIGAPLSTAFLQLDGIAGLHGWQWMFLCEGGATALVGVSILFLLLEHPRDARWLRPEERAWLEAELESETHEIENVRVYADEAVFEKKLARLAEYAQVAADIGCTRCVTFVAPASETRPYHENFEFHRCARAPWPRFWSRPECGWPSASGRPSISAKGRRFSSFTIWTPSVCC